MKVYLDNSATTREFDEVRQLIYELSGSSYGNPSSLHSMGLEAEKNLKAARKQVASGFNADESETVFTSCGTESDNMAISGIADSRKRKGKRIISTTVEHPAVLESLKKLEQQGFEIIRIDVDSECMPDMEALEDAINEDTILISVMAVNNEVGSLMPIKEIGELKAKYNAAKGTDIVLHTDAVQGLGKIRLDTKKEYRNVNLITVSAHKIHGPKGIGALYIRNGLKIPALLMGGGQEKGLRSGTENMTGIAGFGLAAEICMNNFDDRVEKMSTLKYRLREGISSEIGDISINSPERSVCSILNVSFLGTRAEVILHDLEQSGIFVSTGSACSSKKSSGSHVLNAMKLDKRKIEGALRLSLSEFTTEDEIDYTVSKLKDAVSRFRRLGSYR